MTVTYSLDVANSSFFCLYRLLFRWKGSIWKSVWQELCVWLCIYAVISCFYRQALSSYHREVFEDVCIFFDTYSSFIPITFMLGFYVSAVFTRWWQIFDNLGWIDTPALLVSQYIRGTNERARMLRRNCIRYLVLTQAMVYRDVAAGVKRRFPTMEHLVTAGLMTAKELKEFLSIESPHAKYWQPIQWTFSLVSQARDDGLLPGDFAYVDLLEKLRQFRVCVLNLTLFDWVPVPLVYTQVVHLAVRSYFAIALLGRQYLQVQRELKIWQNTIDLYVPIMSILQFVFFVGWMKVAEVLLNPLGEDDDDFECNYILDRNLQVGFSIVDTNYGRCPDLEKDAFWNEGVPEPLYTVESAMRPVNPLVGSCADMNTLFEPVMMRKRRPVSNSQRRDGNDDVESALKQDTGYASSCASYESFNSSRSQKVTQFFRNLIANNKKVVEKPPLESDDKENIPRIKNPHIEALKRLDPEQQRRRYSSAETVSKPRNYNTSAQVIIPSTIMGESNDVRPNSTQNQHSTHSEDFNTAISASGDILHS